MSNSEEMERLAFKAMKVLGNYLDSPAKSRDPEARATARIASSVLSTWATIRQADNNAEALRLMHGRKTVVRVSAPKQLRSGR